MAPSLSKLVGEASKVGVWGRFLAGKVATLNTKEVLMLAAIGASSASLYKAMTWGRRDGRSKRVDLHIPVEKKERQRAAIDSNFLKQIYRILKILIPEALSKETMFCVLIAASLIARTYCDVWMITMTTAIERTIIARELGDFKYQMTTFIKAMPLIAIVNQSLKYGISELKLRFRTQLTLRLQEQYLSEMVYYKMNNLDNRIANPDQLLTQDIDKFCDCVVDLYSNITKPLLDIFLYVQALIKSVGFKTPLMMVGYLVVSGAFLQRLRKPVTRMTAEEQKMEGEFRYVNSRVITNCEEIAFYQGHNREKRTLKETFLRLVNHLRDMIKFRLSIGIIDNVVAKYFATCVGFLSMAISFFSDSERLRNMKSFEIMEDYYATGRIVLRMATAVGRLALAGRDMNKLSGYTSRVSLLMDVLRDMKKDKYVRAQVEKNKDAQPSSDEEEKVSIDMSKKSDMVEMDHVINFDRVPLVTPNGDVLLKEMSFEVVSGRNVLVCGPNGCGKSSLFRVLGQLWPSYGGTLTKPAAGKLFYVPQRPYMTIGSLRDQIIYPDTIGSMKMKGFTDDDLKDFLDKVHLGYILEREGGWDSIQDWIDVLSGGEKQRVAMARLFYHKPQFAILDECTSAVSVDVEGFMYAHCKEVGITLFTVSHRKSLWKYHEYVLYMDGRGSYEFKPIDESTTEFGS